MAKNRQPYLTTPYSSYNVQKLHLIHLSLIYANVGDDVFAGKLERRLTPEDATHAQIIALEQEPKRTASRLW